MSVKHNKINDSLNQFYTTAVKPGLSKTNGNLAPVEPTSTASQAYAEGDLLVSNEQLYKATAAISSGGTITPGTNVSATTLSQEVAGGGGSMPYQTYINLSTAWSGSGPYTQAVTISDAPEHCTVRLELTAAQRTQLRADGVTDLWIEPDNGAFTAYALGAAPTAALNVLATVTEVEPAPAIYGVHWDGSSSTALTRTDDSADFADPVPAVSNGTGSSPFDNLYPWSDMVRVTDADAGEMVKIPKFWYKLTQDGNALSIQIAGTAVDGYSVCPACMDRGDGKGERDYILLGRYHCATSTYKSTTDVAQQVSITRSAARTSIHNLGSTIWQMDFATRFTIWLLYIVEFANWDSQAKIGRGCSASGSKENNGKTDGMSYHTGTTAANRTTHGYTQYRNIEGLWDNVYDWLDGCYYNSNGLNIILNPANFSDSANGTLIGKPIGGWTSALTVSTAAGVPLFYQSAASGSNSTYIPDYWNFSASYPCLRCGGNYGQYLHYGLFYIDYNGTSGTGSDIGCRLQKLP